MTYENRNENQSNQSNQNSNRYQKQNCFCGGVYSERNRHRHEKSKRHKKAEQNKNDNIIIDLMKDDDFNYDSLSNGLKKIYLDYINRNEEQEEYEPIQIKEKLINTGLIMGYDVINTFKEYVNIKKVFKDESYIIEAYEPKEKDERRYMGVFRFKIDDLMNECKEVIYNTSSPFSCELGNIDWDEEEEEEPKQKTLYIDLDDDDTGDIVIEANNFKDFKNKLKEMAELEELEKRADKAELDYMELLRMAPPTIKDIYKITKAETRALTNYGHKIRRQHGEDKEQQMKDNFINVLKLGKDKGFKFYYDYNLIDEEDRQDYNRLNNLKKYHMINKKLSKLDKLYMDRIYSYGCGICGDNEASNTINTNKYNHMLLCDECHYNNVLKCDNCQLCILEHQKETDNNYNNYGLLIDEFFNVICDNHYYYSIKCNCKDTYDIRQRCNINDKYFNSCPLAYDTLIWIYETDDNRGADIDPKEFINRIEESINKRIPQEQKEMFYKGLRDNEISQALTDKEYMTDGYNEETIKDSYIYDKKPFKKNYKKKYVYRGCPCYDDINYFRCCTSINHNDFVRCSYRFNSMMWHMKNQEYYICNDMIYNIIDNDIFKYYKYILNYTEFKEYINYETNETLKELFKRYLKHNNLRYTKYNMTELLKELFEYYHYEAHEIYF